MKRSSLFSMNHKFPLAISALLFATALPSLATPTVTSATAKQRFPWNGLVDITCTVSGIDGAGVVWDFAVAAVNRDSGDIRDASHVWVVRGGTNSTDLTATTSGNYHLIWDASADLGEVRFTNMVMRVNLIEARKVQLWEGGPYWATTNIGAEKPEDYGLYFWWGDTVGYRRENDAWVASDGSSQNFSFDSVPTYGKDDATLQSEGWITADGVLAPEHDAAHVHWGGNWRMPTKDELSALFSNCDWTWTTRNGVKGYVVRGRGDYSEASIFLPAAGYGNGASLRSAGSQGYFWSSVPFSGYDGIGSWYLYFISSYYYSSDNYRRDEGRSVRPVQGFAQ